MDFLYISPEFPPNYAHFVIQLDRAGIDVWGVGEADFYDMPEPLRAAMRWYQKTDLRSFDAVKKAVTDLIAIKVARGRSDRFDCVESHNEQWLRLEGMINDEFEIEGIRCQDIDRLKRKSAMKSVFSDNGLEVAGGGLVTDLDHGIQLGRAMGYPLILKPDEGVGADGIHKIEDEDQLVAIYPTLEGAYVLESFVDGRIVTYDGLADRKGRVIFENSLIYGDGVLECVLGRDTFFYVNRRVPAKLSAIGRRLVSLFDIQRKFFHFEFFALRDGYIPMEINCRPPGGSIVDMMNYSVDDDLYRAYAHMIAAGKAEIHPIKKYFVCYLGRKGNNYVHSHKDILSAYGDRLVEYDENPPLYFKAMGRYRYILRSESEKEILDMASYILGAPQKGSGPGNASRIQNP